MKRFTAFWRHLLVFFIMLLAYQGHHYFQEHNTQGFIYLGIGAALFAIAALPSPRPILMPESVQSTPQLASRWRRIFGLTWVMVSGIMFWQAFRIFYALEPNEIPNRTPWEYFTIGMVTLVLGGTTLTLAAQKPRMMGVGQMVLLAALVGLGLFLRLYQFDNMPPGLWYDEAINGLEARRMLHETDYQPIFVANMTYLHLWLYQTALDWWGETSIQALRVTSVFFGVGTVMAGFLVGKQMRGVWFGCGLAFFLAMMRWSLNFSRIAMTGIETVFFTLMAFYFLMRVVQYGRWRDGLWLGLTVGLGLWFYSAFRFVGIALAIYVLLKATWWQPRVLTLGFLTVVVVVVTLFPLFIFINKNTDVYLERSRAIIILDRENRQTPSLTKVLRENTEKHLQMFHLQGDRNGRHNLPNAPMLDPIMGMLFVLGVGVAVRGLRRPEEVFFILLFVTSLLPGILTYEFEAPQALRGIGVITPIAYFCTLATYALGQIFYSHHNTWPLLAVIPCLLGLSLRDNFQTYFGQQRSEYDSWSSFSTVSTIVGKIAAERPNNAYLFFSPLVSFDSSTEFVAPDLQQRQQSLILPDALPLRVEPIAPATIFLDSNDTWLLEYAKTLYPNGKFQTITTANYDVKPTVTLFHMIDLTIGDLASIQGIGEDGWGVLYIPQFGEYRFNMPRGVNLYIDSQLTSASEVIQLSIGNHEIRLDPPTTQIEWLTPDSLFFEAIPMHYLYHAPVQSNGLLGSFYQNGTWEEPLVLQRIDPTLDMYFHHVPMTRPYTVIWKGWIRIDEAGDYGFSLRAVEWAELKLDGVTVLETQHPEATFVVYETLIRGVHQFEVRYQDTTAYSRIHVLWQPPNTSGFQTIPPTVLRPYH